MNRIAELREAAGLTQADLAERLGISETHMWRIENEKVKLTVQLMEAIAQELNCQPADLIANVVLAEIAEEVESIEPNSITAAIGLRGLHVFRVKARSVYKSGIAPGDTITVDTTPEGLQKLKIGDVVLVEIGKDRTKVLRLYVPPDMLITHRGGANLAITLDDPTVDPTIIGVVIKS